ncbi:MAG: formylglycine-generating enzyme family protein, partial [Cyanothece sp. SIO1E1]|nr:formylglycine-generating enzyme family protein [Cyanothece sp. SIO1E1]
MLTLEAFLNWIGRIAIASLFLLFSACLRTNGTSSPPVPQARCQADDEFVLIPAGEFVAGSDRTERDYGYRISAQVSAQTPDQIRQAEQQLRQRQWFEREPQPQVRSLPAFCMSRNLVTNAEYQTFVQATGHRLPGISAADYQRQGFLVHPYEEVKPYLWTQANYPAGEDQHPVVLISYEDAVAFAQWKGEQDQQTYRLPTAPEWEKAARGTDGRYFPWGSEWRADGTNWAGSGGG